MIITTTIDVPDYVYLFFQKEAKSWNRETAEAQMSAYLVRHVRRTMTARAKKELSDKNHGQPSDCR